MGISIRIGPFRFRTSGRHSVSAGPVTLTGGGRKRKRKSAQQKPNKQKPPTWTNRKQVKARGEATELFKKVTSQFQAGQLPSPDEVSEIDQLHELADKIFADSVNQDFAGYLTLGDPCVSAAMDFNAAYRAWGESGRKTE